MAGEFQIPDIHHLEISLKAKLHELQWKTNALDKLNADLNQNRQMLYDERMFLNKERRRVKELEQQLKFSHEIIEFLEKDKMKHQQEKIQSQVNYDTVAKESDSLLNQARNAKMENIMLKTKIQQLQEEIFKITTSSEVAASALKELKVEMTKSTENLRRNVSKLEQEQEYLRQLVKVTTQFNQRLVAMGMCVHIKHRKQSETIKELQIQLNEVSMKEVEELHEMESNSDLPKMQIILNDTNKSDSDEDLDRQVEAFIEELRNADGE